MKEVPAFIIWGTAPETDFADGVNASPRFGEPVTKALEVELTQEAADYYVMRGVLTAFQAYLGQLKPGGQVSVFITRAPLEPGEGELQVTTASFVINNPDARHVWDFSTEQRRTVREEVRHG